MPSAGNGSHPAPAEGSRVAPVAPAETQSIRPWPLPTPPRRILVIRLQAHGDVVITLPYLNRLREDLPGTRIDLFTLREFTEIPRSLELFDRVCGLGGGRRHRAQQAHALLRSPGVLLRRYDAVIDLQRNPISRWLRRAARPQGWTEMDRFAPLPAGDRTRAAIEHLGLGPCPPRWDLPLQERQAGLEKLTSQGWDPGQELIVLNPAGCWPTRHWPLSCYVELARRWAEARPHPVRFLVMGLVARVGEKARHLRDALGDRLLDLTGQTSPREAFALLAHTSLIVSEDSGLMHMGWVQGVPTIGIFGSSRGDWSRPHGPHSFCYHSGDLECGFCLSPDCARGDLHCLTRVDPADVVAKGLELLGRPGLPEADA